MKGEEALKNFSDLEKLLTAIGNRYRARIIVMLSEKPMHVYEIMRKLGISYPLAYMHINTLRRAGLIEEVDLGDERRKYYRTVPFRIELTPELLRRVLHEI
ncbi:MAG: ArsR/SmtB family transcription factor [Candidatus Methanodesulfokora sp.]|jgi:predicted transcriptional regulator|nr:MAG: transcriptional regulator [Candidatus Korarchaeota archaeon]